MRKKEDKYDFRAFGSELHQWIYLWCIGRILCERTQFPHDGNAVGNG